MNKISKQASFISYDSVKYCQKLKAIKLILEMIDEKVMVGGFIVCKFRFMKEKKRMNRKVVILDL